MVAPATSAQDWKSVTPESVLKLQQPTEGFLCPLKANSYNVEFLSFEVKDYDSGRVVYQAAREPGQAPLPDNLSPEVESMIRSVKYRFAAEMLEIRTLRTALEFIVQSSKEPLDNFRMIERHYLQGALVRCYDFTFGFCIPHGTNSWEAIYEVPAYTPSQKEQYLSPNAHKSDTFYFADGRLIMHNKAEYQYIV